MTEVWTAVRDSREKPGQGYTFDRRTRGCAGTVTAGLRTGDYTVLGLEDVVAVERKGAVAEFAQNLFQARFRAEMARMQEVPFAYVLLEFPFSDMADYPRVPSVPPATRRKIRLTGSFLIRRFVEFQSEFPWVRFHFVGDRGKELCSSLFKRAVEYAARLGRGPTPPA